MLSETFGDFERFSEWLFLFKVIKKVLRRSPPLPLCNFHRHLFGLPWRVYAIVWVSFTQFWKGLTRYAHMSHVLPDLNNSVLAVGPYFAAIGVDMFHIALVRHVWVHTRASLSERFGGGGGGGQTQHPPLFVKGWPNCTRQLKDRTLCRQSRRTKNAKTSIFFISRFLNFVWSMCQQKLQWAGIASSRKQRL